ncbi:hypothetical protein AVEN_171137-1 [Araneus ventricosus]|uniref:Endonuclease/exonuclease/phosphatase domain-containing protein n=1 Tax=Araneus ventricosus TaxID=182803 RepID=A0A4Y2UDM0_ARAVE|nr:hypothetical protein AVEN_171137-1 [Araneus ventricosus]
MNFHFQKKIIYRKDRESSSRGGGFLIAVGRKISSHIINLQLPSSSNEAQAIKVFFHHSEFTIVNLYSPSCCFEVVWPNNLLSQISQPYIIVGDFNIRHPALGVQNASTNGELFLDCVIENNLNMINMSIPTHFTATSTSLLNLAITSPDIFPYITFQVHSDPMESGHFPIITFINKKKNKCSRKKMNWKEVGDYLNDHKIGGKDFQDYNNFEGFCKKTLNECTSVVTASTQPTTPWWNSKWNYLLGQKRKMLRLAHFHFSLSHWLK